MIFYIPIFLLLFSSILPAIWNILQVYYLSLKVYETKNQKFYKDHKAFSIIVAEKGEKKEVIDGLIKNLLSIDYDEYEIIVVSDDPYESFRRKYSEYEGIKKLRIVNRDDPKGKKAGALNYAIKLAQNPYLVFLDADARVEKDFLKKLTEYEFEILSLRIKIYNAETWVQKYYMYFTEKVMDSLFRARSHLGLPIFPNGSALSIKKEILLEIGGWREGLITEDLELGIRAFIKGHKIEYADDILVFSLAPYTLTDLYNQIERWSYGSAQLFIESIKMLKKGIKGLEGFIYSQQWGIYGLFILVLSTLSALDFLLKIPIMWYFISFLIYGFSLVIYGLKFNAKITNTKLPITILNASMSGYIKGLFKIPLIWKVTPKVKEVTEENEKISFLAPLLLLLSFINTIQGEIFSAAILLLLGIMEAAV